MDKLRIFICGHDYRLDIAPDRPFIRKINLNHLKCLRDEYQNNQFAESRLFLTEEIMEPVEYIGFATASWRVKWPYLPSIQFLDKLDFQPNVLWCPKLEDLAGNETWVDRCETWWPSLVPYIKIFSEHSGLSWQTKNAPIANNFILHWSKWEYFIEKWREIFFWFFETYPMEEVIANLPLEEFDKVRVYGYVLERLSMLILSNMPEVFKDEGFEFREIPRSEIKQSFPKKLFRANCEL